MNNNLVVLFSFSVIIAAVIGLLKFRKMESSFYPFIFCLCIASVNEVTSMIVSRLGYTTNINNNIYVLAEACLLTWQFKNWNTFPGGGKTVALVLVGLCILWWSENDSLFKLKHIGSYFRIAYSFLLVLAAIYSINKRIFTYEGKTFGNPVFLICNGLIIYFTSRVLVEIFWVYGLALSPAFSAGLFVMLTWINLFVNVIFIIAVICIPVKKYYLKPSSWRE